MYIGNDLQVAESGNKIIDDISSSFNGSTTSFALLVGGAAPVPFPINTQQIYISVNGVIQEPDPTGSAGFKLLGNNIVFSSAPANGHAFFGVILAGADYVTVGTEFPAGSATAPSITFGNDNNTGLYSVTGGTVGFTSDGAQTFTMDSNGFNFPDGKKVNLGSSSDLSLYHSGSHSYIEDSGTGRLITKTNYFEVDNAAGNEAIIEGIEDGAVNLYYNGNKKFETTNTGTNVTGIHVDDGATHDGDVTFTGAAANVTWDKSEDDLIFADNARAKFGTGLDLHVYHNGSNSVIREEGTGNLNIQTTAGNVEILTNTTENSAKFISDGAVELYHNNVKTFETLSDGIHVQGPEGGAGLIKLSADEGDDNADNWLFQANTDGTFEIKNVADGSWDTNIKCAGDGQVELYFNDSKKFETTSNGVTVTGGLTATTSSYFESEVNLINGTTNSSRYIDAGLGDGNTLVFRGTSGGDTNHETLAEFTRNGAISLYYDASKKFETNSSGIAVTGQISCTDVISIDGDNKAIRIGDSQNFQLTYTGSEAQIKQYDASQHLRIMVKDAAETAALFKANGAVELYYDNSKKFETTSTGATVTGSIVADNTPGRNLLTNGTLLIDQRNATVTVNNGNNNYAADRWYGRGEGSKAVFDVDHPAHGSLQALGTKYSLRCTVTTSATTVSGDVYKVAQRIEGQNITGLAMGTVSAKSFTISFIVRSDLTGTYSGSIMNSAQNRSYPFTYTVNSSGGWEAKSITIPGDTSGTWLHSNGIGMELNFDIGSDANKRAAAGSWHASRAEGATGAVQLTETNNKYIEWAKIQLEVGSVATEFEHLSYGDELARCQRYYQTVGYDSNQIVNNILGNGSRAMGPPLQVPMRATPTLTSEANLTEFSSGTTRSVDSLHQVGPAGGGYIQLGATMSNGVYWKGKYDAEL